MARGLIHFSSGGVSYYEFESLHSLPGLRHAVLTRHGGVSVGARASLNVGHLVGDDPAAVAENERRAVAVLGAGPECVVTAQQVHAPAVVPVGAMHRGTALPTCDGLATDEADVVLMLRFADCVPVLMFDPVHRAVALLHAGWRGWVAGVVSSGLRVMTEEFGSSPGDLVVGIGPAIGACCYQVGPEVVDAALRVLGSNGYSAISVRSGATNLDLPGAVRMQLQSAGVRQIEASGICTSCQHKEFFSHRADRGDTGRFAILASLVV